MGESAATVDIVVPARWRNLVALCTRKRVPKVYGEHGETILFGSYLKGGTLMAVKPKLCVLPRTLLPRTRVKKGRGYLSSDPNNTVRWRALISTCARIRT
jgi:hypothetical protein